MFSEGVIRRMRDRNSRNLPHVVKVYGPSYSEKMSGGLDVTDVLLYTLKGRVAPSDIGASPNEHIIAYSDESHVRWWVILAWDAPFMEPNYWLVITGQDSDASEPWSRTVQILAVMDKRSNRVMTKLLCLERK